jgi:hypothetical protein
LKAGGGKKIGPLARIYTPGSYPTLLVHVFRFSM